MLDSGLCSETMQLAVDEDNYECKEIILVYCNTIFSFVTDTMR